jgi:glycosyltransferase involved in cell wall biosynthesis
MSPESPKKILFLFRELAGYFVACLEKYVTDINAEVTVVYWPLNSEAPFQWQESNPKIKWVDRKKWDVQETIKKNQSAHYDLIVVSGWSDEGYNRVVRSKGSARKVITFDTQWDGSWRMKLGRWWLWWRGLRHFDSAWVPGERQRVFAQKLFFKSNQIFTGFYVADTNGIDKVVQKDRGGSFKIGVVARLVESKGFPDAVLAIIPLLNQNCDWQLAIWGTGPLLEKLPRHPQIIYHGFTQPEALKKVWKELDVFLLPSRYEPWGVVVHEAAAAGLPLVLSNAVGAADQFVQSPSNGFIFPVGDYAAMQIALNKIESWSITERGNCENVSIVQARTISHSQWIDNLEKLSKR